MQLSNLKITHIRNITTADLCLHSNFNLFVGANGVGKTSILEAIYILTTGKSFRTAHQEEIIHFFANSYALSGIIQPQIEKGQVNSIRTGVLRFRGGRQKMRVNDQTPENTAEFAKILPVQLLNVESYRLLEESSLSRRQFMDWGVFHVEHTFADIWQRYTRVLQQRNKALKILKGGIYKSYEDIDIDELKAWEQELFLMGHQISDLRASYLQRWMPIFSRILEEILGIKELEMQYHPGWEKGKSLQTCLKEALIKDKAVGYTTVGPHRADLSFFIGGVPAKGLLSRGQLKLFVCALFLARAEALFLSTDKKCLFMIDDLNAELDNRGAKVLVERLRCLKTQVIITAIEKEPLMGLFRDTEHRMFHVEHGVVR